MVKEMLSLEENIPWDIVEKYWKVRGENLLGKCGDLLEGEVSHHI